MKLKVKSHVAAIYGIIFTAFTAVAALVWQQKDFVFWCFYISTTLILANLFFLHCCAAGDGNKKSEIVNQALFLPPAIAYLVVCAAAWGGSVRRQETYHGLLAVHIVIFALSAVLQICLFHVKRKMQEPRETAVSEEAGHNGDSIS